MIVGAQDSGKSSLCTLLCNYAARMGEQVFINEIIFI
jgi:polynucleotide 5'-kinase involved in rRNA processing